MLKIPNGKNVKHRGVESPGVGHLDTRGGGQRNQFGKDFAAAGFQWTTSLCRTDSDEGDISGTVVCLRLPVVSFYIWSKHDDS